MIGTAPGGGYDTYLRALSRSLGKFIPGEPGIIVQNVPAAGGMVLANQLYNTVPKDGTYIGMVRGTVIEVLQPGYVLHDRLLRPAMVGVAKAGSPPPADGTDDAA